MVKCLMALKTHNPHDLLGQKDLCDVLGISQSTVSRRLKSGTDLPKSHPHGKQQRWRYDEVLAFKNQKKRKYQPGGNRELTRNEVLLMFDRWHYYELHRRIERIHEGDYSFEQLKAIWNAEARVIWDANGNRMPLGDPKIMQALIAKTEEIVLPEGRVADPAQLAIPLQVVWLQVLDTERGWLAKMPPR
jgi:predicted DNA-binding transcriptional regulator AlpA